jgi:hypothetical protein
MAFALARTPMYDSHGNMDRLWQIYFGALDAAESTVAIDVLDGIATPDLSKGTTFVLVLTADTTLALPAGTGAGPIEWTLIVQQDSVGGHALITTAYHMAYSLASAQSPASTESVQRFSTDATSTRVVGAPSIDQPIP